MEKLTIVIPMSGAGSRFAQAGYSYPKPFLPVGDKAMIAFVVENLTPKDIECEFIFICQKAHYEKYDLENVIKNATAGIPYKIVQVDSMTEGAACTVLLAADYIGDNPLMIANSDQWVNPIAVEKWFSTIENTYLDGMLMTTTSSHPKWSYALLNENGFVVEVAEKRVISNNATTGIYFWKNGKDFVESALSMIQKDMRTNNEFYIAPTYNEMILNGKNIGIHQIDNNYFFGIGEPESYEKFLDNNCLSL